MKTGKILHRFTTKDGREVILRTPRREDLDDLIEFITSLGKDVYTGVKELIGWGRGYRLWRKDGQSRSFN